MMWLTEDAQLICTHGAMVKPIPHQVLVSINNRPVLVQPDPELAPIIGCPNINPLAGLKPCLTTLPPQNGYSRLVRINGMAACLDTLSGMTDGTPPGAARYSVVQPGQIFVSVDG